MRFGRKFRGRLAVLAALGAVCVCATGGSVSNVLAATNLVSNGTFEGSGAGSLSGWGGSSGTLSLVTGNGGGHAAQLTAASGAASMYAYTVSKPVTNAVAGAAYTLSGDIQSTLAGQSVCLVLKELTGGTTTSVGSAQSCLTATSTWQSFPAVNYTVKTTGDSLTVNVLEKPAVSGARFAFDNIVLTAASSDTQAPTVPQSVAAVANSATSVTVSWAASTDNVGVAGYDVYRASTKVGTVGGSTTSFTDTTAQPSTTYSYTVDAFDAVPNTSAKSAPATVTTPAGGDTQAPTVPQSVAAVANSATSVTVSWAASTDNVGVAGYDVYRGSTKVGTVGGSTTSFTDTTAQPSTTYSYTVDAFDAVPNTSAKSAPATVTTPAGGDTQAPTVPQSVAAVANSATSVTVSWAASTDNVGVAGYDVYRASTKVGTVGGSTTSFTDTTAQPSTTYSYTVDAFDAVPNTSAKSAPATVTTPAGGDTQAPTVPQSVAAVANSATSVTVSWAASTDNVGVAGYDVYRGLDEGGDGGWVDDVVYGYDGAAEHDLLLYGGRV